MKKIIGIIFGFLLMVGVGEARNNTVILNMGLGTLTSLTDDAKIGLLPGGCYLEFDDQTTDEANFINCNVGIGTSAPSTLLDLTGGDLRIQKQADDFAIVADTVLGLIQFYGDDDTASADDIGGQIEVVSDATWTDGAESAYMAFSTMNDGTLTEAVRIDSEGMVGVGATPTQRFTVKSPSVGSYNTIFLAADESTLGAVYEEADGSGRFWISDAAGTSKVRFGAAGTSYIIGGIMQFGTASGAGNVNITPASAIDGLYIDQDNDDSAMWIDSESTSDYAMKVYGFIPAYLVQDITGGYGLKVRRNIAEVGSSPLVNLENAHASNTQSTLFIDHDSTGGATGYGLHVDSENAAGPAVFITSPNATGHLEVQGPVGVGTGSASIVRLSTAELTIVDNDELGRIDFISPLATPGGDAIAVAASIWAESEATFSASVNTTALVFATGTSEAAAEQMRIDGAGRVGIRVWTPYKSEDMGLLFLLLERGLAVGYLSVKTGIMMALISI